MKKVILTINDSILRLDYADGSAAWFISHTEAVRLVKKAYSGNERREMLEWLRGNSENGCHYQSIEKFVDWGCSLKEIRDAILETYQDFSQPMIDLTIAEN